MSAEKTKEPSLNAGSNTDDFHLQPKENSPVRKEKGIPMWIIYIALIIIAGLVVTKIYIWKSKPINELVYDSAVKEVENDLSIFAASSIQFEEFDEKYVTKKNDETYDVEVAVCVNNTNGVKKNYVYDVQIKVKGKVCKTVYCMRRTNDES